MKINWKIRLRNPMFLAQIALAILLPILAYFGLNWQDMTTWQALGGLFLSAVQNPVVLVAVLVSVYNASTDPTTPGVGDSKRAMEYTKPGKLPE